MSGSPELQHEPKAVTLDSAYMYVYICIYTYIYIGFT